MLALLLQIVGIIALLMILLLLAIILRWFFAARRVFRQMGALGAPSISRPARLTLRPSAVAQDPPAEIAAGLGAAGFAAVGTFEPAEMPHVLMTGWLRADGALAAWCRIGDAGPRWLDLCARFADGATLTVTNAVEATPSRVAPWKERGMMPADTGAAGLLAEFGRRLAGRVPVVVPAGGFAQEVADLYARETLWRALAGPDDEEIRRTARAGGMAEPGPEVLAMTREAERSWCNDVLETTARELLLQRAGTGAAQWEAVRDEALVVTDRQRGDEVYARLPGTAEGQPPVAPFAVLDWWNARAEPARRLALAARIDEPLRAELWLPAKG